ncbi:hypothetical protein HDU96_005707 [Phlyctochytrium bullatum]|nr:hypothetical protein HDU96_005707 [Phlyctochytrium bullatum]
MGTAAAAVEPHIVKAPECLPGAFSKTLAANSATSTSIESLGLSVTDPTAVITTTTTSTTDLGLDQSIPSVVASVESSHLSPSSQSQTPIPTPTPSPATHGETHQKALQKLAAPQTVANVDDKSTPLHPSNTGILTTSSSSETDTIASPHPHTPHTTPPHHTNNTPPAHPKHPHPPQKNRTPPPPGPPPLEVPLPTPAPSLVESVATAAEATTTSVLTPSPTASDLYWKEFPDAEARAEALHRSEAARTDPAPSTTTTPPTSGSAFSTPRLVMSPPTPVRSRPPILPHPFADTEPGSLASTLLAEAAAAVSMLGLGEAHEEPPFPVVVVDDTRSLMSSPVPAVVAGASADPPAAPPMVARAMSNASAARVPDESWRPLNDTYPYLRLVGKAPAAGPAPILAVEVASGRLVSLGTPTGASGAAAGDRGPAAAVGGTAGKHRLGSFVAGLRNHLPSLHGHHHPLQHSQTMPATAAASPVGTGSPAPAAAPSPPHVLQHALTTPVGFEAGKTAPPPPKAPALTPSRSRSPVPAATTEFPTTQNQATFKDRLRHSWASFHQQHHVAASGAGSLPSVVESGDGGVVAVVEPPAAQIVVGQNRARPVSPVPSAGALGVHLYTDVASPGRTRGVLFGGNRRPSFGSVEGWLSHAGAGAGPREEEEEGGSGSVSTLGGPAAPPVAPVRPAAAVSMVLVPSPTSPTLAAGSTAKGVRFRTPRKMRRSSSASSLVSVASSASVGSMGGDGAASVCSVQWVPAAVVTGKDVAAEEEVGEAGRKTFALRVMNFWGSLEDAAADEDEEDDVEDAGAIHRADSGVGSSVHRNPSTATLERERRGSLAGGDEGKAGSKTLRRYGSERSGRAVAPPQQRQKREGSPLGRGPTVRSAVSSVSSTATRALYRPVNPMERSPAASGVPPPPLVAPLRYWDPMAGSAVVTVPGKAGGGGGGVGGERGPKWAAVRKRARTLASVGASPLCPVSAVMGAQQGAGELSSHPHALVGSMSMPADGHAVAAASGGKSTAWAKILQHPAFHSHHSQQGRGPTSLDAPHLHAAAASVGIASLKTLHFEPDDAEEEPDHDGPLSPVSPDAASPVEPPRAASTHSSGKSTGAGSSLAEPRGGAAATLQFNDVIMFAAGLDGNNLRNGSSLAAGYGRTLGGNTTTSSSPAQKPASHLRPVAAALAFLRPRSAAGHVDDHHHHHADVPRKSLDDGTMRTAGGSGAVAPFGIPPSPYLGSPPRPPSVAPSRGEEDAAQRAAAGWKGMTRWASMGRFDADTAAAAAAATGGLPMEDRRSSSSGGSSQFFASQTPPLPPGSPTPRAASTERQPSNLVHRRSWGRLGHAGGGGGIGVGFLQRKSSGSRLSIVSTHSNASVGAGTERVPPPPLASAQEEQNFPECERVPSVQEEPGHKFLSLPTRTGVPAGAGETPTAAEAAETVAASPGVSFSELRQSGEGGEEERRQGGRWKSMALMCEKNGVEYPGVLRLNSSVMSVNKASHKLHVSSGATILINEYSTGSTTDSLYLFSHANGLCKELWEPLIHRLLSRTSGNVRCYAWDERHHGQTAALNAGTSATATWWEVGHDTLDVIRWAKSRHPEATQAFGVGHSYGGCQLLMTQVLAPGLLDRLVLFEPVVVSAECLVAWYGTTEVERLGVEDVRIAAAALRRRRTFGDRKEAWGQLRNRPFFKKWTDEAFELYLTHAFSTQPDGTLTLRCTPERESFIFLRGPPADLYDQIPNLQLPVLYILGEHSEHRMIPFQFRRHTVIRDKHLAEITPNGEFKEFPGTTHMCIVEEPDIGADFVLGFTTLKSKL